MAKQSGYLQKLAAQQAVRDEKTRRFTLQQCKDMMLITMHEDFGWGEDRRRADGAGRGHHGARSDFPAEGLHEG